jgi:hypothetical protein
VLDVSVDNDGDGYTECQGDCNDGNPSVHPGATEICNGFDDDCDGVADNNGAVLCDDGNICTDDTCGGASGCVHSDTPAACSDDNVCTADACDPAIGCLTIHKNVNLDATGFSSNRVDGRDLVVLAHAWNSCPGDPNYTDAANLDQADCVDLLDFHLFMDAFGRSCP